MHHAVIEYDVAPSEGRTAVASLPRSSGARSQAGGRPGATPQGRNRAESGPAVPTVTAPLSSYMVTAAIAAGLVAAWAGLSLL
jgi:hypothetical protein